MGLNASKVLLSIILVGSAGCASAPVVKPTRVYIACCDPGLNADDKDMCKWMEKNGKTFLRDGRGDTYVGVWDGCKQGEEPWRKWE